MSKLNKLKSRLTPISGESKVVRGRQNSHQRGYDYKWKAYTRPRHLAQNPLCVYCARLGIVEAATVVDHIIPHRGCKILFNDKNNLQSLCKRCHDSVKQSEERRAGL